MSSPYEYILENELLVVSGTEDTIVYVLFEGSGKNGWSLICPVNL